MRVRVIVTVMLLSLTFAGCSGLSGREQRALTGGAIGAGVGTAGAVILGGPIIAGVAAGVAAGAVGGIIADEIQRRN